MEQANTNQKFTCHVCHRISPIMYFNGHLFLLNFGDKLVTVFLKKIKKKCLVVRCVGGGVPMWACSVAHGRHQAHLGVPRSVWQASTPCVACGSRSLLWWRQWRGRWRSEPAAAKAMEGLRFSVVATGPARGRRREQRAVGGGGVGCGRGRGPPACSQAHLKRARPVDGPGTCGQGCILFSIFKI